MYSVKTPRDIIETALVATESELGVFLGMLDEEDRKIAVTSFNLALDMHEHDIKGQMVESGFVANHLLTPNAVAKLEHAITAAGGVRNRGRQLSPEEFAQQIADDRDRIRRAFEG